MPSSPREPETGGLPENPEQDRGTIGAPPSGETEPIVLSRGNLFCVLGRAGDIAPAGARDLGLYHEDTRHLSHLALRIAGSSPTVLSAEAIGSSSAQIDLTLSDTHFGGFFADPVNFLHLRRRQLLDQGELVERITLTNHLRRPVDLDLSLLLAADFADIFEVRGAPRAQRGEILAPAVDEDRIEFGYRGRDGELYRTLVRFSPPPSRFRLVTPEWRLSLQPGETRALEIAIIPLRGDAEPPAWRPFDLRVEAAAAEQRQFVESCTRIRCDNTFFQALLGRSLSDIDSLRISVGGRSIVGAGIPWFAAPFGRDSLITSLSCLAVSPALARETLRTLAHYQGSQDDPWREEEPGKILHELRRGEMARAGEVPHSPYYGTIDATPLWIILLRETLRWTGDIALLDELFSNAERALEWIERRLDEGAGLIVYQRTHTRGLENQGWKDSRDGISFPDGTIASPPIALIEVQGYAVAALDAMASLRRRRGDGEGAARLRARAAELRGRIERDFWSEEIGFYALALDGAGRRVQTITSNPGHLAFCRAIPADRAARVAEVLGSEAMFSGWGVRTLARGQAVYNPLSYHNGTVWPHDNALCAFGLSSLGQTATVMSIVEGLYAASLHFRDLRLPELFCGTSRGSGDSLVHYPVSCSPQAWASAAFFLLLQSTLGIHPDAEHGRLIIRNPRLPSFLQTLDLDGMRVGRSAVPLHFERHGEQTHVDLEKVSGDPSLKVLIEVG